MNLLERIKPEYLTKLRDSESIDFDPALYLSDFKTLGEMTITQALKIIDPLNVSFNDLPECFEIGVMKVNEVVDVDYTNDLSRQPVRFDAEIEIGARLYTLVATGYALIEFDEVKEEERFIELDDVSYQLSWKGGRELDDNEWYGNEVDQLIINHCVNP